MKDCWPTSPAKDYTLSSVNTWQALDPNPKPYTPNPILGRLSVVATSFMHSRGMRDGGEASLSVGGGGIADSIEALQRAPEPSFSVYDVMCARKDVAEAGETP
jgi:hypothetical protein